ncbi:MAG: hypothetical protein HQK92_13095 [Nitrospirae bacterium]|nr:hypothetical protein [Nitrospirota bacterium]
MIIKLTGHAAVKMKLRDIKIADIEGVVNNPLFVEIDRFDDTLRHFIGYVDDKYLKVKWQRWLCYNKILSKKIIGIKHAKFI